MKKIIITAIAAIAVNSLASWLSIPLPLEIAADIAVSAAIENNTKL